MKLPWSKKREVRSQPYTDSYTAILIREASGSVAPTGRAQLTAYAEMAAGAWARAGMVAKVSPDDAPSAISPAFMSMALRDLVTVGESLWYPHVDRNGLRLDPIGSYEIKGDSPDPSTHRYVIYRETPDGTVTNNVSGAEVLHLKYSVDAKRPYRGVGPIERAGETSDLLSALSVRMREEASARSVVLLPDPSNPDDDDDGDDRPDPTARLAGDMAKANGGVMLVKTQMDGAGDRSAAPQQEWTAKRVGSMIPEHYGKLLDQAGTCVANAMGVPPGLLYLQADGTNQREAYRRFAHGSVVPVATLIAQEIADKLEVEVKFDFSGLYASDVVGRASSFNRLVAGGMAIEEAARVSGVLGMES